MRASRQARSCARLPLRGKSEADIKPLVVTPWDAEAGGDVGHSGQRGDAALDVVVKVLHLLRGSPIGHYRQIHGEHTRGVDRRTCLLKPVESLHEHGRSSKQQKRGGDLHDGEDAQPPVAASGDARSAADEARAQRRVARGKAGNQRQKNSCHERQRDAKPHQGGVEPEAVSTHGESRCVPPEHRDHGSGEQQCREDSAAAEHEALGQQRTAQGGGVGSQR